jgi:hypothetical protein
VAHHVLHLAAALAIVGITPRDRDHGFERRYAVVDGSDFAIVGRRMFQSFVNDHNCRRIEVKRYPREKVIVRLCYL